MERVANEEYTAEDSPIIRMTTAQAREKFDETVSLVAAGDDQVILSQDGKDVAAIICIEEFWLLERLIGELEDKMDVEEAKRRLEDPNEVPIPYEQVRKELGLV